MLENTEKQEEEITRTDLDLLLPSSFPVGGVLGSQGLSAPHNLNIKMTFDLILNAETFLFCFRRDGIDFCRSPKQKGPGCLAHCV